jgi:hypothetical protein
MGMLMIKSLLVFCSLLSSRRHGASGGKNEHYLPYRLLNPLPDQAFIQDEEEVSGQLDCKKVYQVFLSCGSFISSFSFASAIQPRSKRAHGESSWRPNERLCTNTVFSSACHFHSPLPSAK